MLTIQRRPLLWLIPGLLFLHNAEEAIAFRRLWPLVRERVSTVAGISIPSSPAPIFVALLLATLVPVGVVAWSVRRPEQPERLWPALAIQAVVLLNVASHIASAVLLSRGYSPGLITAIVVNLPFSCYLFTRAGRERWVSRQAFWLLLPAAALIHGPLLLALLWATGVLE